MTTLTYIHHALVPASLNERAFRTNDAFRNINERGIITGIIIAWAGAAILSYLIAVYYLFGLSNSLQQKSLVVKDLVESNTIVELNIQQNQTSFIKNNADVLESMQKISEMRYVGAADTAVSRAEILEHTNQ